jgi:hypothetical protein
MALLCQALPLSDIRTIYSSLRDRKKRTHVTLGSLDHNQVALLAKIDTLPLPSIDIRAEFDAAPFPALDILAKLDTMPLPVPDTLAEIDTTPLPAPARLPGVDTASHPVVSKNEHAEEIDPAVTLRLLHKKEQRGSIGKLPVLSLPITPVIPNGPMEDDDATEPRLPTVVVPQSERSNSR